MKRFCAVIFASFMLAVAGGAQSGEPVPRGAERLDAGRFTVVAFPSDLALARSLLAEAQTHDTFPGLARPAAHVVIALAPDDARFHAWTGDQFPEWGAAAAFPETQRIVMHGHRAGSGAGNPLQVLRHELAHLALGESLGRLPPRWFDEGYAGYAAAEWGREELLATNLALVLRGPKTFGALDSAFEGGATRASGAYALAYRAIAELAAIDPEHGLSLFFADWKASGSLDIGVRQAYGLTLDDFQDRWRSRTRRRYGGLALLADLSVIGVAAAVILLPVFLGRKKRDRKRLETLRLREADQERRARESALDALLSGVHENDGSQFLDTPKDDL